MPQEKEEGLPVAGNWVIVGYQPIGSNNCKWLYVYMWRPHQSLIYSLCWRLQIKQTTHKSTIWVIELQKRGPKVLSL